MWQNWPCSFLSATLGELVGAVGNFVYIVAHCPMKSGVGSRVGFTFSWLDWIIEFPGGLRKRESWEE